MSSPEQAVPILAVENLAVHFGGVKAVDDVSFSMGAGELLGLLGPNGSGKSTLLGAVSRLTRIKAGTLTLAGTSYANHTPAATSRLGIARTFQTVRLLSRLSVLENVMLGADRAHGNRGSGSRNAALASLERVGIADLLSAEVRVLPYGLQRKVEIARALTADPKILLLDEPTAGMSRQEREEIGALITQLVGEGLAQILVEHDVKMMVDVCPRLIVMSEGQVIADGRAHDVVRQKNVQEAYLGGDYRAPASN